MTRLLRTRPLHALCATALAASLVACSAGRQETWKAAASAPAPAAPAPEAGSAAVDPIAAGDALWAERGSEANIRAAIAAWESAIPANPENGELFARLARGEYLLADGYLRAGDKKEEYLATFTKGVDYAERALTSFSPEFKKRVQAGEKVMDAIAVVGKESVPALYWYSSNLGKWARAKGFATTLGNKDTIKALMDRCLALDPTFFYGGPDRYFGAFYAVAPSFAGGDLNKSEEHFKKSLALAPSYLATKVLMAENLAVKKQDREMFKRLLDEVVAAPDDLIPELVPESRIEKQKAKELLAQIDEKF